MPGANPRSLRNTLVHPLARMLPQLRFQQQVYRLGEKNPPAGTMVDHAPNWNITTLILAGLGTQQVRVNVQPDFHWLATLGGCTLNTVGGFRAQIYDTRKKLRFADRGVRFANLGGNSIGPQWLRDPYRFDLPNSQVLLVVQNLESAQNEIQIAMYGQVVRFNQ